MFNLSKKTEYGVLALRYLSGLEEDRIANVSEIARSALIPKELLAKILSELVKAGLAVSFSGPAGGFRLARPPSEVSLAEILRALESRTGVTECVSENGACHHVDRCTLKLPMAKVNNKVTKILEETTLTDLMVADEDKSGRSFRAENARLMPKTWQ